VVKRYVVLPMNPGVFIFVPFLFYVCLLPEGYFYSTLPFKDLGPLRALVTLNAGYMHCA